MNGLELRGLKKASCKGLKMQTVQAYYIANLSWMI